MENLVVQSKNIGSLIYEVRGKQVMLDSDLANLYNYSQGTKALNQAVKRHIDRFPDDFYFQVTWEEFENLRSQVVTANVSMVRSLPYVFTEEGVAMLATILRTEVASQVSINIMRAFVMMRKYISNNLIENNYYKELILEHDKDIKLLQESFKKFEEKKVINEIYFDGQIFDAYSKLIDITKEAKSNLVIIDGYADKSVLDMIRNISIPVTIICKEKGLLKEIDVKKYEEQYNNLTIIYNNTFHDRYIIIDNKKVYHCGASLNYAGSKTFSINILEDCEVVNAILNKINKLKGNLY